MLSSRWRQRPGHATASPPVTKTLFISKKLGLCMHPYSSHQWEMRDVAEWVGSAMLPQKDRMGPQLGTWGSSPGSMLRLLGLEGPWGP